MLSNMTKFPKKSVKPLRRYRDFFAIFKMADAIMLNFQKFEILTVDPLQGPMCVIVPSFIENCKKNLTI